MKLKAQPEKPVAENAAQPEEEFFRLPRAESLFAASQEMQVDNIEGLVTNARIRQPHRHTLQVADDSMQGADIRAGDFVVYENRKSYSDGAIVAVQLGERQLVRRYFYRSGRIHLECDPPRKQIMILEKNTPNFRILGQVMQIIREVR